MNMKSIMLASAAALVATSAFAADAVKPDAAPVAANYVKVCDAFGAGFFYIPGSDECIKFTGYLRANARYNNGGNKNANISMDAHFGFVTSQATDIGRVDTYLRFDYQGANAYNGNPNGRDFDVGTVSIVTPYFAIGYILAENVEETGAFGLGENDYGPKIAEAGRQHLDDGASATARFGGVLGGGWTAYVEASGATANNYWNFVGPQSSKPVISGQVDYKYGATANDFVSVFATDDTATKAAGAIGGWSTGIYARHQFNDALAVGFGVGASKLGIDSKTLVPLLLEASYDINKKTELYFDGVYRAGGNNSGAVDASENKAEVAVGVSYTIANNLYVAAEEDYVTPYVGETSWSSLLRLARKW